MIMDTPIHFLSPNPEQKEALDELEKLLEVLERKPSRRLERNTRFVKGFTRALLIAGREHSNKARIRIRIQKAEAKQAGLRLEKFAEEGKQLPKIPTSFPLPPVPPPPSHGQIQTQTQPQTAATSGINIKGGGKSFESFVQKVSKENGVLRFNIIEPEMEPADWRIFNYVKGRLKQQIIKNPALLENENFLLGEIKNTCQSLKMKYSDSYLRKIKYYLVKYIKGFGKIDPLIKDPDVSEIICDSYDNIKVKYKDELISTNIQFDTNEELDNFILNVAEKSNRKVSETDPELTMILQGMKISAFYNPIMGSRFTIAKQ